MQIKAISPSGTVHENLDIDRPASKCPHCHKSITAIRHEGFRRTNEELEVVFKCPDDECRKIFIGYYNKRLMGKTWMFVLYRVSLGTILSRQFSEDIFNVSPSFVEIINQSVTAEEHELNHVAGIGYRKALEFLIKDYLIKKYPEKTETILNKFLGNCIKDHLDNPNIKDMAERAVWLGNDETHYNRKWDDKDINDLKLLIDITVHWIEMEQLTEKYRSEMR